MDIIHLKALIRARDRAVESYGKYAMIPREIASRLFDRLEWLTISPAQILDIGCAIGETSQALQRHFPRARVWGVDVSSKMCRETTKRGRWFKRRILSLAADPSQLPFATNCMDFIFSNLVLQSAFDWSRLCQEWFRILRPDGLLLFSVPGPYTLKEYRSAWSKIDVHPHTLPFVDMHDIGDVLLREGFSDPVVDMELLTIDYDSVRDLCLELRRIGASNVHSERNPTCTGKQRWKQMIEAYPSECGVQATLEVIYVLAWKPPLRLSPSDSEDRAISIPITAIKRRQR